MKPTTIAHMRPAEPVKPTRLGALARRIGRSGAALSNGTVLPAAWPPRDSAAVMTDVAAGRQVRVLEIWRLLADKAFWSQERARRRARQDAEALWTAAEADRWLDMELRRRAALVLSKQPARCPLEIGIVGRRLLEILEDIHSNNAAALLRASLNAAQPPAVLLWESGMPPNLPILRAVPAALVVTLPKMVVWAEEHSGNASALESVDIWSAETIAAEPPAARDAIIPDLLKALTVDQLIQMAALRKLIVSWSQDAMERVALRDDARKKLDSIRGSISWDAILHTTELIVGFTRSDLPALWSEGTNPSYKQATARRALSLLEIWSNYASRMVGVTVHVPVSELERFGGAAGTLPKNVHPTDGNTTFSILHFPRVIVLLPILGGSGAVARFYKSDSRPTETLTPDILRSFTPEKMTVSLFGYRWQSKLYEAIHSAGLRPNDHLKWFRGIPRAAIDPRTGMPRKGKPPSGPSRPKKQGKKKKKQKPASGWKPRKKTR